MVKINTKDGKKRWVTLSAKLSYNGVELDRALVVACDVTDLKEMEESLKKCEEGYRGLFANILEGYAYCRMVFDQKGKPVDFIFLEVNEAFEENVKIKREKILGKKATQIFVDIEKNDPNLFDFFGKISLTRTTEKLEFFFKPLSKWLSVSAYSPEKGYFALVIEDISRSKKKRVHSKLFF